MKLFELLNHVDEPTQRDLEDIDITGVTDDSRDVKRGYMFVAVEGYNHDGHHYINEALENGASVVVGEQQLNLSAPYIQVNDTKRILGQMASHFYGHPSDQKIVIGVTGTNGKTTTSYMLKAVFEQNGYNCGLIGTIEYFINGESLPSKNTTPGAVTLQKLLHDSQDDVVIIEISSHALKQHRVAGVQLDEAIFTNLDSEHLDYHNSMQEYFESKFQIFNLLKENGYALLNSDDKWCRQAIEQLRDSKINVHTVGIKEENDVQIFEHHQNLHVKGATSNELLELKMPGLHNRYNAAFGLLTSEIFNLNRNESIQALNHVENIRGRFEIVYFPGNKKVVVDYAHTPKGFYHCLNTIRECGARRIIHVFGFRGARDPSKRLSMMKQSIEVSDYYILTFDDLNDTPENDMEQTLNQFHNQFGNNKGEVVTDRTLAIERAIELAGDGDWVVITGKGHESFKHDFKWGTKSDLETVEKVLEHVQTATRLS
ncbi:UDP-N-acetylmuramoyl-L-alanyl-D-glutamate--2,6-diaminopimelate ligase [Filobacillus milosensis]|uniref:UDP-N-acetylmuramoyl-L-alanyl-D-glutamate--2, 6-diaminopimelate ligase n=1 Tax=Filobacillus milosensis TaxID=94137 RepID=UPI0018917F04|nr:UDP-N-acetylmuramoyl-L-alanyl-D-glutamate--2,6-diaminopimelate ligase [Filobacillus milosensis]